MAQDTKNVLVLYGNNAELAWIKIFDASLRSTVVGATGQRVEFYNEYFDVARFPSLAHHEAFINLVRTRYAGHKIDVVVLGGSTAFDFLIGRRKNLFPDVPFVYSFLPPDRTEASSLPAGIVGVPVDFSPLPTIELALRLHPGTKQLVFVTGAGPWDIAWEKRLRRDTAGLKERVELEFLAGLPTAEVLARLGALPKNAIVFTPGYFRDGAGEVSATRNAVEAMAAGSTAPVYTSYETHVGTGAVGGVMPTFEAVGRKTGEIVAAILEGKQPSELKLPQSLSGAPVVDWRQVRRWGIDERLLPADTGVKYREPSMWDNYRREILIALAVVVLQAAMIALLLFQRVRRRRIEADLVESQQLMALAASAGELGMWARRLPNGQVWANPVLRSLLGFGEKDTLQPSNLLARIHPDDSARVVAELKSAQDSGRPFEAEYRAVLPDGRERWILAKGRTVADPRGGGDQSRMGVVIDITARKHSDDLLKNERAFLRQVIDINPNLIFAKDREGRFTLANQAVADVFGTTVENIVGKTDADFNPNLAEVEHFRRVDREVMDSLQERYIPEETITSVQGKTLWMQTIKRPILDADGRANQVLGSATNITRRKEAEQELARQRSELAHLARVSALGQLSASIAHQLNQPLAAILGNAEAARQMLAREPVDLAELRQICDDIINEDHRAADVIRRLRELFKRGETGHEPLDLNALVRETLELLSHELLSRQITVAADLAPALPPVRGGRVELQQVLMNLILNAAEVMSGQAGRRVITIRSEVAGADIRLSVADNGPGIALADLPHVFDPFWSTKHDGMGMGLAICQTIVAAHGGGISAANSPDGGAVFNVTLPVRAQT